MNAQELEESGIAEVFFEISAFVQRLAVNLRYGKTVSAEMSRELKERDVLFAHIIDNSDSGMPGVMEPKQQPTGCSKAASERLHLFGRCVEMLFKEGFEYLHQPDSSISF